MKSEITITLTKQEVRQFRKYFGENDKTPFEHLAYKIFDDALKNDYHLLG